jgi:hypothetical protein
MPIVLDGIRNADWRRPGLLPIVRVGQGGTAQAKPGRFTVSTRSVHFFD